MAEKKLTIVVEAKNKTQAGLGEASGAMSRFAKSAKDFMAPLRNLWQAVYGPIALAIAATLLFQKAMRALTGILTAASTAIRKLEADKAARDFATWEKAVSGLSKMFQTLNRDLKNWRDGTKAQTDASADLAKAGREHAKAIAMAAAATDEDRKKIEQQFDAEEKRIASLAKIEAAKAEIQKSDEDAESAAKLLAANDRKSLEIIKQQQAATERLAKLNEMVAKEKELGTTARGGDAYLKQLEGEQKAAQELSEKLADAEAKLFDDTDALRAEQLKRSRNRKALETALAAASVEDQARLVNQAAEAEQQALEKTQKEAKERADKISELRQEEKEASIKLADEVAAKERQNHEAFIAQQKEQIAAVEARAKATIQAIIDEARASKDDAKEKDKEDKRIAKNRDKEKRGIKLSRKEREFMDAVELRDQARGGIKGAQQAIVQAQGKLDAAVMAQQQKTLEQMLAEDKRMNVKLEALLAMG
jgi:hypothetical protein